LNIYKTKNKDFYGAVGLKNQNIRKNGFNYKLKTFTQIKSIQEVLNPSGLHVDGNEVIAELANHSSNLKDRL